MCEVCGETLPYHSGRGYPIKYCSPTCRNRAGYLRALARGSARNKTLSCSICSKPMAKTKRSLDTPMCLDCRSARKAQREIERKIATKKCATCPEEIPRRRKYCDPCRANVRTRRWADVVNPKYRSARHKKARQQLLDRYTPGDPCCLCGEPMWPNEDGTLSDLHADHEPGTDTYRGLAHALCNLRDGATRARAIQAEGQINDRPWLRKDYHPCPVCGAVVEWASQGCCSKGCLSQQRAATRKARALDRAEQCVLPLNVCAVCTCMFVPKTTKSRFCSRRCSDRDYNRRRPARVPTAPGKCPDCNTPLPSARRKKCDACVVRAHKTRKRREKRARRARKRQQLTTQTPGGGVAA